MADWTRSRGALSGAGPLARGAEEVRAFGSDCCVIKRYQCVCVCVCVCVCKMYAVSDNSYTLIRSDLSDS